MRLVARRREGAIWIEGFQALAIEAAALFLEVPPGDAVLHRHHDGLRPEQIFDVFSDPLEVIGLHTKHDEILLAGSGRPVEGLDVGL